MRIQGGYVQVVQRRTRPRTAELVEDGIDRRSGRGPLEIAERVLRMGWHQLIRLTRPRAGRDERPCHSARPRPVHAEHDDHLPAGVATGLDHAPGWD